MVSQQQDLELFSRALHHYSEQLKKLQDDEDIKKGNSSLRKDLDENSKNALQIAKDIDTYKTENITNDNLKLIKTVLKLYKQCLIDSKESLKKKLGVEINCENVDEEISQIEKNFRVRGWN